MTTEVLRNMLYAGSRTLTGLGFVVMDEVHYLADRFRGAVWEEVIIGLPESVAVVSLSATVSNAEEFGAWLTEVRGGTMTIVEERRPVPLHQHVLVGRRLFPLFEDGERTSAGEGGQVNRQLERMAREDVQLSRMGTRAGRPRAVARPRSRHRTPGRVELVEKLDAEGLLPAIVFVFSRAGCDAAVQQCHGRPDHAHDARRAGRDRRGRRRRVRAPARRRPARPRLLRVPRRARPGHRLPPRRDAADVQGVRRGAVQRRPGEGRVRHRDAGARHQHAGPHRGDRAAVEVERRDPRRRHAGGVHPAHRPGRAPRHRHRGARRRAVAAGSRPAPGRRPRVARARIRSTPRSSRRTTWRSTWSARSAASDARELLEQSFAQFQADRAVVGLARQIRKADEALEGYQASATCELGDFMEYAALRRELSDLESSGSKARRAAERDQVVRVPDVAEDRRRHQRPGRTLGRPGGRARPRSSLRRGRPAPDGAHRQPARAPAGAWSTSRRRSRPSRGCGSRSRSTRATRSPAATSPRRCATGRRASQWRNDKPYREHGDVQDPRVAEIRAQLREHPCHACPDRESHARWAERYLKLERDTANQRRRIEQRTNTVARQFDRVCEVLRRARLPRRRRR